MYEADTLIQDMHKYLHEQISTYKKQCNCCSLQEIWLQNYDFEKMKMNPSLDDTVRSPETDIDNSFANFLGEHQYYDAKTTFKHSMYMEFGV